MPKRRRTDQIKVHYKLNINKGVLDFLNTYLCIEATYTS
jgi:hypothetical protein